jgi:hypothetical protein
MMSSPYISRRKFVRVFSGAAIAARVEPGKFAQAFVAKPTTRPLIGAIRWDAWYDPADGKVAQAVEKALGAAMFHYRMPFFGRPTGPDSVRINGDSQAIIDREIGYAVAAGLDYWAFCTYAADDPLSNALKMYLSSQQRHDIGFCLITGLMSQIEYFKAETERHIGLMREPGYVKVLGGRPLYYVMDSPDEQMEKEGGLGKIAEWVLYMRQKVQANGGGNPYFVLSEGNPERAKKLCHALDLDAIGLYATAVGPFGAAPYAELVRQTEAYWDKLAATGIPIVPNVMTGWDTRPREKSPPPWNKPPVGRPPNHYYQEGQPDEIANHVKAAESWLAAHPKAGEANTALIYAWDECDEGFGALVPTYDAANPDGNADRIHALAAVLRR